MAAQVYSSPPFTSVNALTHKCLNRSIGEALEQQNPTGGAHGQSTPYKPSEAGGRECQPVGNGDVDQKCEHRADI